MQSRIEKKNYRRDSFLPKGRQVDDTHRKEIKFLLKDLEKKRDLLIEALHIIQDSKGFLTPNMLVALAEIFKISQVEVYEVASFYHHFDILENNDKSFPKIVLRVCEGLTCEMNGAVQLIKDLKKLNLPEIRIQNVPCIGKCDMSPAAQIGKRLIEKATVKKIINSVNGPFDPLIPNYTKLDEYLKNGGYNTLIKIVKKKIDKKEIIKIITESGLRGLGGAGFPSGKKWEIVSSYDEPRYMTVNGDEGEPGTFKDRYYLENSPHRIIEGAMIASLVVGCEKIFLYIRDEYPAVIEILKKEIKKLEAKKLLFVPIEIRRGAGAYICGEESAMIESIEGKRGIPRHRPPYIAEVGLFGRPTLNHNIETLFWIPEILNKGSGWFSSKGWSNKNKGLRSYSVSGRVNNPGLKIAPAGIPLRILIDDYCGGMLEGHNLKAFFPGGASGGIFPAKMADTPLDFGYWENAGGFIGSHAIVIMSQHDSVLDAAINTMKFFKHESCGQCTPCRNGTEKMTNLLVHGEKDFSTINDLIEVMSQSSICGLGQAAGNCVKHLLKYFPEEMNNAKIK